MMTCTAAWTPLIATIPNSRGVRPSCHPSGPEPQVGSGRMGGRPQPAGAHSSAVEHRSYKPGVAGSNPAAPTLPDQNRRSRSAVQSYPVATGALPVLLSRSAAAGSANKEGRRGVKVSPGWSLLQAAWRSAATKWVLLVVAVAAVPGRMFRLRPLARPTCHGRFCATVLRKARRLSVAPEQSVSWGLARPSGRPPRCEIYSGAE